MKKRIHIKAPFDLVMEGRETQSFKPGVHLVEQEVADHWYVKAMSEEPVDDPDAITADEIEDLLNQVEALTARAEAAEAETVDLKARAEKAEKEASDMAEQVKVLQDAVVEMTARAEAAEARAKVLEEEAAKAAADSAKTGKKA